MAGIAGEGGIDVDEGDVPKGNLFDQFITLVSGLFQPMLGVLSAAGMIKGVVAILAAVGVAKTDGLYIILNAAGDGLFPKKVIPDAVKVFVVPFCVLFITVPLAFLAIGPVMSYASDLVGLVFTSIYSFSPIVYGIILGALWQVLVMFGLHWGLIPLVFLELAQNHASVLLSAAVLPNFTQAGVLLAIMMKTKEKKVRELSIPAFISAMFGVTEPSIYGITLPMRTPFIISCAVSAIVGAYVNFFNVTSYTSGGMGIFLYPSYINPTTHSMHSVIHLVIGTVIAIVLAYIVQMFVPVPYLYGGSKDETKATVEKASVAPKLNNDTITAPIIGEVVKLENVPDQVFASGAMGQRIAINPTDGTVVAPADAEVTLVFPTGHAIGLRTENGAEILIHIGMDTVSLAGKGFKSFVQVGDKEKVGQKLLEFDLATIREAGLPIISPIIVTNSANFKEVQTTTEARVNAGDFLIATVK